MTGAAEMRRVMADPSPASLRHLRNAAAGRGPDDCWPWPGALTSYGYGRFSYGPRAHRGVMAHRVALSYHLGRALELGEQACHRCDNPPCVNPAHLFVGSNADNCRDMRLKQRQQKKVSDEQVLEIRRRYAAGGVLQRELGAEYGIGQTQVSTLVRKAWMPGEPRPRR